jgi:hypothetical protein
MPAGEPGLGRQNPTIGRMLQANHGLDFLHHFCQDAAFRPTRIIQILHRNSLIREPILQQVTTP